MFVYNQSHRQQQTVLEFLSKINLEILHLIFHKLQSGILVFMFLISTALPLQEFSRYCFFIAFGHMISNCSSPHNNCSPDRVASGSVRIKTILYQEHRHFHTAFCLKFQGQPVAILKKVDRLWSDYMSSNFIKLPETRLAQGHGLVIAIRHSYWLLVAKPSGWVSRERTCNLPNN